MKRVTQAAMVGRAFAIMLLGNVWSTAPAQSNADTGAELPNTLETVPVTSLRSEEIPAEAVDDRLPASLPTITVTAQKRDERLTDVPIAVDSFSGGELLTLNVDSPLDLSRITPGLVYNDFVGFSVVYLRGVGTDQFLPSGDSSVTTYIDGIYTPFAHALAQQFGEIERIEVLKGPQGTLYGRNSTAGAINVVTTEPQGTPGVSLLAQRGNFNAQKFKAYLTGGIGSSVRLGLSLLDDRHDSYYRRPQSGTDEPFRKETARGGQLRMSWDIAEALTLDLSAMRTLQDGSGTALVTAFDTKPLFSLLVPESGGDYVSDPDVAPRLRAENDLFYGRLRWTPAVFDVKLSASYQDVTTLTQFDFEGTPTPLATFRPTDMGARITTAEIQLLSKEEGLLSKSFEWTAGYYYFAGRDAGFRDVTFSLAESLTDPLAGRLLTTVNNLLRSLGLPLGVPDGVDLYLNGLVDTDSHAIYGQFRWAMTDSIGITLGGRQLWEERHLTGSQVSLMNADDTPGLPVFRFQPRQRSYRNFSPKVTLDARLIDDTLLYASWQQAYKSGTFNVLNILKPPSEVKPESITTYEVGLKGELASGNLRYGLAAFHNQIRDLQVLVLSLQSSGAVTLENAPRVEIKGLEFDFKWIPMPRLLPGLLLNGGATVLDGEYTEYPDGSGFGPQTGLFRSNLDFTGNETVRTPDFSVVAGFQYRHPAPGGTLLAAVSTQFSDGYFFDAQNASRQDAYSTVQARLGYNHSRSGVSISIYGENLTGERFWYNQFQTDFNTVGTLGPPKVWGVELSWEL